jgi:cytochrome P450
MFSTSFLAAGIETVAAVTGFALLGLAHRPSLRAALRDKDSDQMAAYVEESVRISCPIPSVRRWTTRDVEIGGATLSAYSWVDLGLRAANYESGGDQFPTMVDGKIRRNRHWGFGGGAHRCIGMHLARLELTAILDEWLKQIPDFEPPTDYTPEVVSGMGADRLDHLPLRWNP